MLACQSPHPCYWYPNWRKRTSSLTILISRQLLPDQAWRIRAFLFFFEHNNSAQTWNAIVWTQRLRIALLHNGNLFAVVPLAHLTTQREKYNAVKYVLENIVMISTSVLFVLTWRWWIFCWDKSSASRRNLCIKCMWNNRYTAQHCR